MRVTSVSKGLFSAQLVTKHHAKHLPINVTPGLDYTVHRIQRDGSLAKEIAGYIIHDTDEDMYEVYGPSGLYFAEFDTLRQAVRWYDK